MLLKEDIVPILVGGTHYYIQSVIWDILIDLNKQNLDNNDSPTKKTELPNSTSSG